MHSHYYCISNEKCQHAWNTWVLQTLQLPTASIVQCHWHCYKVELLIILWIHDLLHRFHLSVSRSCLESVHKNVSGFIPTDNTWEKVVNAVVYIFLINITTFTTLFSVTDIMSLLKQCKLPILCFEASISHFGCNICSLCTGRWVCQSGCCHLTSVGTFKQYIFQTINPTPPMVSPPCSDGGACELQELWQVSQW
jgi:hypothetical protein